MLEQIVIPDQSAPEEKSDLCCKYLFFNTIFLTPNHARGNSLDTDQTTPEGTVW